MEETTKKKVVLNKTNFIKFYVISYQSGETFTQFLDRCGKPHTSKAAMRSRLKSVNIELMEDGYDKLPDLKKETFNFSELFEQGLLTKNGQKHNPNM
tara:strand:- start:146 stop:436 length:291 start_codon:yes stop_codon:yes gene_type:complete